MPPPPPQKLPSLVPAPVREKASRDAERAAHLYELSAKSVSSSPSSACARCDCAGSVPARGSRKASASPGSHRSSTHEPPPPQRGEKIASKSDCRRCTTASSSALNARVGGARNSASLRWTSKRIAEAYWCERKSRTSRPCCRIRSISRTLSPHAGGADVRSRKKTGAVDTSTTGPARAPARRPPLMASRMARSFRLCEPRRTARASTGAITTDARTASNSAAKVVWSSRPLLSEAVATMKANSPHAAMVRPTVNTSARDAGTTSKPDASLPRPAQLKSAARPRTVAEAKERTGTMNPHVAAKKSLTSHDCSRLTCLIHASCSRGIVQQERPARKAPSK
mmetsp:Transcript_920/g.2748  ORF Transcript_920/g.2748 Transcript_920/m.2748 type:complete len:339 (+) Transcript_920:365-1381(+)